MLNIMGFYGNGMMDWGGGTLGLLGFVTWLVWLGVGVLLLVWLWQKISRK